jgi:hypothetical protein
MAFRHMAAVVLQGPANSAPERILGPFASIDEATEWARRHPRDGGYSVAQELTEPDDPIAGQGGGTGLTSAPPR